MFSLSKGAPPLSSLEKDKDIDFDLLQDLMDVDIDPLDIDLEKDPLAAKVFKVCELLFCSIYLVTAIQTNTGNHCLMNVAEQLCCTTFCFASHLQIWVRALCYFCRHQIIYLGNTF